MSDTESDNNNNNADEAMQVVPMVTTMKQHITPYLPPPVVAAMAQIDPPLEPFLGPEPSMTLMGTLGLGFIVWKLLSLLGGGSSRGSAIQDDDDQDDATTSSKNKSQRSFDSTLLFCGPSLAGKTSLFYKLLYPKRPFPLGTVQSLSSNVGYKQYGDDETCWRYLDVPGYWGPDKLVSTVLKKEQTIQRIVLVLDSTQPVSKAADYLHALVQYQQQQAAQKSSLPILIACHKAKAPKAKNFRRIKLNLRNELERLEKLSSRQPTNIQDWDEALSSFEFCSSSIDPPLLQDIESFCESGKLVSK